MNHLPGNAFVCILGRACGLVLACSVFLFAPGARAAEDPVLIGPDGCTEETIGQACDDEMACTDSDRCFAGNVCGGFIHCDDGDPCTVDACGEGPDGCVHVYDELTCGPGEPSCPVPITLVPPDPNGDLDLGGAGCGCRTAGSAGGGSSPGIWLFAPLVLLGLAARRLRGWGRRAAVVSSGVAMVLAGNDSRAEVPGFDTQIFRPTTTATGFLTQEGTDVLPKMGLNLGLTLDVADAVLVARDSNTDEILDHGTVVGRRATMHLGAGLGLGAGFEVGADLPLVVDQRGDLTLVRPGATLDSRSLGDLRLHAKLRLRGGRLALAAVGTLTLPTGSSDNFTGGSASITESFVGSTKIGPVSLAMNVGYRMRKNQNGGDFTVGDEVIGGGAVSVEVLRGVWLTSETYAVAGVGSEGRAGVPPAETVVGARWRIAGPWLVHAGAGMGLTDGYGTPRVRGVFGVTWAPGSASLGRTRPVLVKRRSSPVTESQLVSAVGDDEQEAVAGKVQVAAAAGEIHVAVARLDSDGDGIPDAVDRCPRAAETVNQVLDEDGCPDADRDNDRIADLDDRCPSTPEASSGRVDADGCAEVASSPAVDERTTLAEVQLFPSDSAGAVSPPVLASVVEQWNAYGRSARLLLIGHADERGSAAYNDALAARRAERVRVALVAMGIPVERIEVVSQGNRHPRVPGRDETAWKQNRRVEFVLIRR